MEGVWIVVGSVVVVALLVLAVVVTRLRGRVRRLEGARPELRRAVVDNKARAAMKRAAAGAPDPTLDHAPAGPRATLAMPGPITMPPKPGGDDGETTSIADPGPPSYARRSGLLRPPAPLSYPDLIGCEDIADEAARPRLGHDEETPPRSGRTRLLVPTYRGPEKGGAA